MLLSEIKGLGNNETVVNAFGKTKPLFKHVVDALRYDEPNKRISYIPCTLFNFTEFYKQEDIYGANYLHINGRNYDMDMLSNLFNALTLKYFSDNPEVHERLKKHVIMDEVDYQNKLEEKWALHMAFQLKDLYAECREFINRTKMKLTIELVPKISWGTNLRSILSNSGWDKARKKAYRDSGLKCAICGGVGPKHPVEAHELWVYNREKFKQTLIKVIALCPNCHMVKHYGRATATNRQKEAFAHLKTINDNFSEEELDLHLDKYFQAWKEGEKAWEENLVKGASHNGLIKKYRINLTKLINCGNFTEDDLNLNYIQQMPDYIQIRVPFDTPNVSPERLF